MREKIFLNVQSLGCIYSGLWHFFLNLWQAKTERGGDSTLFTLSYFFLKLWFIWVLRWYRLTTKVKKLYCINHNWIFPQYLFCTVQKHVSMIKITHLSMTDLCMMFVKLNPWNTTVHFSMFCPVMLHWEAPLGIVSHGKIKK